MFETLEVKDPREARDRYMALLAKEKAKFEKIENEYKMSASRKELRIEELKNELRTTKDDLEIAVSRDAFEKERKAHKANVAKWEKVFKEREEAWKVSNAKLVRRPPGYSAEPLLIIRRANLTTTTSTSRLRTANTRNDTWRRTRSC
jgi:Xaa-Pro aminopeptidase